jgi:hypothetical protein
LLFSHRLDFVSGFIKVVLPSEIPKLNTFALPSGTELNLSEFNPIHLRQKEGYGGHRFIVLGESGSGKTRSFTQMLRGYFKERTPTIPI